MWTFVARTRTGKSGGRGHEGWKDRLKKRPGIVHDCLRGMSLSGGDRITGNWRTVFEIVPGAAWAGFWRRLQLWGEGRAWLQS